MLLDVASLSTLGPASTSGAKRDHGDAGAFVAVVIIVLYFAWNIDVLLPRAGAAIAAGPEVPR